MSHEGQLVGLVTVKDVLRHEAAIHHRETQTSPTSSRSRGHRPMGSDMTDQEWERWGAEENRGNGLEVMLEEVYSWVSSRGSRVYNILYSTVRGSSGSALGSGRGGREVGFEYELETGDR